MDNLQTRNGHTTYKPRGADRRRSQDTRESLEVTGPGGVGFRFSGAQMFPVLLLLLFFCFVSYALWVHDSAAAARQTEVSKQVSEIRALSEKQEVTHKIMLYVLYVCHAQPEDCKSLNLLKPPELRDLQR